MLCIDAIEVSSDFFVTVGLPGAIPATVSLTVLSAGRWLLVVEI